MESLWAFFLFDLYLSLDLMTKKMWEFSKKKMNLLPKVSLKKIFSSSDSKLKRKSPESMISTGTKRSTLMLSQSKTLWKRYLFGNSAKIKIKGTLRKAHEYERRNWILCSLCTRFTFQYWHPHFWKWVNRKTSPFIKDERCPRMLLHANKWDPQRTNFLSINTMQQDSSKIDLFQRWRSQLRRRIC